MHILLVLLLVPLYAQSIHQNVSMHVNLTGYSANDIIEFTMNILSDKSRTEEYFHTYWIFHNGECVFPKFSFTFENIDFDDAGEAIKIIDNSVAISNHSTSLTCNLVPKQCGVFTTCVNNWDTGYQSMATMQIDIIKSDAVYAHCLLASHKVDVAMNANLTIQCGDDRESIIQSAVKITETRVIDLSGAYTINSAPYPTRQYTEHIISNIGAGEYGFFNTTINFINGFCYLPILDVTFQDNGFQNYNQYMDLYYYDLLDQSQVKRCGGPSTNGACSNKTTACLHNFMYTNNVVDEISSITIGLLKSESVNLACNFTMSTYITVRCGSPLYYELQETIDLTNVSGNQVKNFSIRMQSSAYYNPWTIYGMSGDPENDVKYMINIEFVNGECIDPKLSFKFAEIDMHQNYPGEYIYIYQSSFDESNKITECWGTYDGRCDMFTTCFSGYELQYNESNSQLQIGVRQGHHVNTLELWSISDCDGISLDVELVIECCTINHLNWKMLNETLPDYQYNIQMNQTDLTMNIDLQLDYIGYSFTDFGYNKIVGTTYIFDFQQFQLYSPEIQYSGSCSNRLASSYINKSWIEYWKYSLNPSINNQQLASVDFLAYGPLPIYWTLYPMSECGSIHIHGEFSWSDLQSCTDYNGKKLMSVNSGSSWINMSGRFYLSIVSPDNMNQDIGHFYSHDLVVYPFQFSVMKSVNILNKADISTSLITIRSKHRTFTNKYNDGGYNIILSTETSHYLQLQNPMLLSYPTQYNTWIIEPKNNFYNNSCYVGFNDMCSQYWNIAISDLFCPISFSGTFSIRYHLICNKNKVNTTLCDNYVNDYGDYIVLSIHLKYSDRFDCDNLNSTIKTTFDTNVRFYKNVSFTNIANNKIYRSEVDEIFVEIEINDLLDAFKTDLINVYVCSTQNSYDTLFLDAQDMVNSGCFDFGKVNAGSFSSIILNGVPLLDSTDIYNPSSNHASRFSFLTPVWTGNHILYIQCEMIISLKNYTAGRRRVLLANDDIYFDEILHTMSFIQITRVNDKKTAEPTTINVTIAIVTATVITVICVLFVVIMRNRFKSKNEQQNNVDIHAYANEMVNIGGNNHNNVEIQLRGLNPNMNNEESDDSIEQMYRQINQNPEAYMETQCGKADLEGVNVYDTMVDSIINDDVIFNNVIGENVIDSEGMSHMFAE